VTRTYLACRCSSVEMFGGRLGYEPHEVRRLLKLAEAMDAESSVEDRIQAKALSVPKAVELAPILNEPSLFDEESGWVKQAQKDSYSKTRRGTRRPGEGRVSVWRGSAARERGQAARGAHRGRLREPLHPDLGQARDPASRGRLLRVPGLLGAGVPRVCASAAASQWQRPRGAASLPALSSPPFLPGVWLVGAARADGRSDLDRGQRTHLHARLSGRTRTGERARVAGGGGACATHARRMRDEKSHTAQDVEDDEEPAAS